LRVDDDRARVGAKLLLAVREIELPSPADATYELLAHPLRRVHAPCNLLARHRVNLGRVPCGGSGRWWRRRRRVQVIAEQPGKGDDDAGLSIERQRPADRFTKRFELGSVARSRVASEERVVHTNVEPWQEVGPRRVAKGRRHETRLA